VVASLSEANAADGNSGKQSLDALFAFLLRSVLDECHWHTSPQISMKARRLGSLSAGITYCEKEMYDRRKGRITMHEKKNILTYEGLQKYEEELHNLKVVKRQEVAQKIKEAREQGDLSENAEYDAAKDEQRDIEARIEELEKILKNAEVVVEDEVDLDKINIGCQVKILDVELNEELDYKIVGSTEANSLKGKISNESPVGKALIGSKVGETVEVETQAGIIKYKVLEIQRSN